MHASVTNLYLNFQKSNKNLVISQYMNIALLRIHICSSPLKYIFKGESGF